MRRSPHPLRWLRWGFGTALIAATPACGVSMRTVVEGDMRFEHCYRIDEDSRVAATDKRACWSDWTARYTRGQDGSRVRYAVDRRRALGGESEPEIEVAIAAPAVRTATPLSPYAPPAQTEAPTRRDAVVTGLRDPVECKSGCLHTFGSCVAACVPGTECAKGCEDGRRACDLECM